MIVENLFQYLGFPADEGRGEDALTFEIREIGIGCKHLFQGFGADPKEGSDGKPTGSEDVPGSLDPRQHDGQIGLEPRVLLDQSLDLLDRVEDGGVIAASEEGADLLE